MFKPPLRKHVSKALNEIQNDNSQNFESFVKQIYESDHKDFMVLTNGLYAVLVDEWIQTYSQDRILMLNGDQLLKDPLPVLQELERFLGLMPYFTRNHLRKGKSGFYCFYDNKRLGGGDVWEKEYCIGSDFKV